MSDVGARKKEAVLTTRVLVLSAGSAASNNLIRSLKSGEPSLFIVGCHNDLFILKKSIADLNCAIPRSPGAVPGALRRLIKSERIELVIPNSEADVADISALRARLPCRTFLPRASVIAKCEDKLKLSRFLSRRGFPAPRTLAIASRDRIDSVFRCFGAVTQLWCRVRKGSGSIGAIPVANAEQTRAWIAYWEEMRDIPPGSFTLSEYLPGRDLTVQCLLKNGTFIMAKMHERLAYHTVGGVPSGVSSSAALAKMVFEPSVLRICIKALLALDPKASGIFFIDLKQDSGGRFCITEINAGRFANVPTIHDLAGIDNMAVTYVNAALDEPLVVHKPHAYDEDYYILRSIDTLPAVVIGSELFDDIGDPK